MPLVAGYFVIFLGAMAVAGVMVWLLADFYCNRVWKALVGAYTLYTLQWGFAELERHGRQFPAVSIEDERMMQAAQGAE